MKLIQYGMNFAFGGTGVFDTLVPEPNMLEQIGYLEQLIKQKVYTKNDLVHSFGVLGWEGLCYLSAAA